MNNQMADSKYGGFGSLSTRSSTPTGRYRQTLPLAMDMLSSSDVSGPSPPMGSSEWHSHLEARVESSMRDVRSVADAQARLLRVVEGISEELNRVGSGLAVVSRNDANSSRCSNAGDDLRGEVLAHIGQIMSTVDELQHAVRAGFVDNGGGTVASRLARHDAEIAEMLRSRAEEAVRTNSTLGDMQRLVGGLSGQFGQMNAQMAELRCSHGETTAQNIATIVEMQRQHQSDIQNLQLASSNATTRATQADADIVELRRICDETIRRQTDLAAEIEVVKEKTSQIYTHESKISEIQQLQVSHVSAQEMQAAELQQLQRSQASVYEAKIAELQQLQASRFSSHESKMAELQQLQALQASAHETKITELQQLQATAAAERKQHPSPSEQSEMHATLARRVESLQSQMRDEIASLQKHFGGDQIRSVMQSQAAAIKALDEQLWLVDEQLWQTERRLTSRVDEISAKRSSPPSNVSAAVLDTARSNELCSPHFNFSNEVGDDTADAETRRENNRGHSTSGGNPPKAGNNEGSGGAFADAVHQKGKMSTPVEEDTSKAGSNDQRRQSGSFLPSVFVAAADELAGTCTDAEPQSTTGRERDDCGGEMSPMMFLLEAPASPAASPGTPELHAWSNDHVGRGSSDNAAAGAAAGDEGDDRRCNAIGRGSGLSSGDGHSRAGASASAGERTGGRKVFGGGGSAEGSAARGYVGGSIAAPAMAPPSVVFTAATAASAAASSRPAVVTSCGASLGTVLPAPVASTSQAGTSALAPAGLSFPRPVKHAFQASSQQMAESCSDQLPDAFVGQALKLSIMGTRGLCISGNGGGAGGGDAGGGGDSADRSNQTGPYCVCEVPGRPRSRSRTEVARGTTDFVWNHEAAILDYIPGDPLVFTLWKGGADDRLVARSALDGMHVRRGFEGAIQLLDVSDGAFLDIKVAPGIIFPRRVRVTVHGASGLGSLGLGESSFCVCEVRQDKRATEPLLFKTKAAASSVDPTWNETMDLDPWLLGDALDFVVGDDANHGKAGRVSVPSEMFFPNGLEGEVPLLHTPTPGGALTRSEATLRLRIVPASLPDKWRQESLELLMAKRAPIVTDRCPANESVGETSAHGHHEKRFGDAHTTLPPSPHDSLQSIQSVSSPLPSPGSPLSAAPCASNS
eukprot:TRINITY_DN67601_c0_g1_i1.p1 TRINITY_DN67601_c0_g1~~TRINITY_DN67601_c0_g1_i1.p1  ORF type:complete len:1147 (+),score=248.50 TRINITY_DN67601_c0_g1_i1:161-3601(+)